MASPRGDGFGFGCVWQACRFGWHSSCQFPVEISTAREIKK
jgi:hypothetical protein